ncbi:hypothetical protein ACFY8X_20155 [Streptomyces tanashiensis]|uniref:hypothetical protein n=1 Tax=Streptomyces tanashiensis TaxID=67367 RepID=UPI0036E217AD
MSGVPLPASWAALWSAARREAYANDQDNPDTLIAVTAASDRSKADEGPAE